MVIGNVDFSRHILIRAIVVYFPHDELFTLDQLLAKESGIAIIPDLKEMSLQSLELVVTSSE